MKMRTGKIFLMNNYLKHRYTYFMIVSDSFYSKKMLMGKENRKMGKLL